MKLGGLLLAALVAMAFLVGCGSGVSSATQAQSSDKFAKMDKDPKGDKGSP